MAAKGKVSQINAPRSLGELEAELEKRTAERDEALAREAASAEVLQMINTSAGNARVLEAILEKALALCAASFGDLSIYDGNRFLAVATRGLHPLWLISTAIRLRLGHEAVLDG